LELIKLGFSDFFFKIINPDFKNQILSTKNQQKFFWTIDHFEQKNEKEKSAQNSRSFKNQHFSKKSANLETLYLMNLWIQKNYLFFNTKCIKKQEFG
jgi:response regulator RpfG family c-di-GMP phosphodiesterase